MLVAVTGMTVLLWLIMVMRLHALVALVIVSLGVGLGAMIGQILEIRSDDSY